ncbi:hypothetical protein TcasGA2_TC015623 [Tribolium castaneum]|uniref:Ionotropic glutamate receptor C-terminal domain-containing protein n=1 Tax=Tribolium castaneum TaxID=7070 RepID=D2A601_TRICA|nr:hypothetical protein TcasGA2_TC015623 [Tribolium castaneum]
MSSNFDFDEKLQFLFKLNQTKILTNPIPSQCLEEYHNYIIVEQNIDNLVYLQELKFSIDTKSRFLLILENTTEDDLKQIFETCWHLYIFNVVIYNWTDFVTWYPYDITSKCGTSVNLVTESPNPYANKIPKKLHNCPVNITWEMQPMAIKAPFDKTDPGYNIRLMDTVAKQINLNVTYLIENINYLTLGRIKGEYSDLRNEIIGRNIDLGFAFGENGKQVGTELELSLPFTDTNCFFILPPRRKIQSSFSTLVVFSIPIWGLIFLSIFLMTTLWKILTGVSFGTSLFQMVQLLLQCVIIHQPKNTLQKLAFVLFFCYVLNLNWIYISQLSGILSQPSYEPKILKLEELAKSDKKLDYVDVYNTFLLEKDFYDDLVKH